MRGQDREGPTARRAQIALDTLCLLLFLGTCRISEAFVSSMKMHHPLTTAGTLWTQSVELIFAKLNGGDFPKSSSAIKPLYFGPEILINSGSVLRAGSGKKCLALMGSTMRMTPSFCATVCTHASPTIRSCTSIKALQTSIPRAAIVNQTAFGEALLRGAEATLAIGKTKRVLSIYEQLTETTQLPTRIRAAALRGEIIARGSKGKTLLKQSLASPEYELFAVAIRVSLELRRPDMTKVIAESLPQLSGARELVAFKALGALGDDCAVSALLPLTKTGDKSMRLAAIQAAAATGKPAVVPVMVELLGEADADVANAAQDALAAITHPTAAAAVEALLANPS